MKLLKNKLAVTIVVLSVTFLGLIIYTAKSDTKSAIESGAGSALNPVQSIMYNMTNKVKGTLDFFLNFSEVKAKNKELEAENGELKNKLASYSDLEAQNERLAGLLKYEEDNTNYNYIACDIIGYNNGASSDGYIVNKGTNDGVQKGLVVIASKGLVGKVTSVADNWCVVQTILNEDIAVGVMPKETRDQTGYLTGYKDRTNGNVTKVYDLPLESDVKEGEEILTSGVGLLYPKEIPIGKVVKVEEDKVKVMKSAIVKPYVDFDKLEELVIVCPKDMRDIKYDQGK